MPEKQQGKCHTGKTTALNHGDGRKHMRGGEGWQKGRGEAEEPYGLSHWSYKAEVFPSGWTDRCCPSVSGAIGAIQSRMVTTTWGWQPPDLKAGVHGVALLSVFS